MADLVTSDVALANRRSGARRKGTAALGGATAMSGAVAGAMLLRRGHPTLAAGATALGALSLRRGKLRTEHFEHAVTIGRPLDKVFAFLEDVGNWPVFSSRLIELERAPVLRWRERLGPRMTRWWKVTSFDSRPPSTLAWRAETSGLCEVGTIYLAQAPGDRGTEVREVIEYQSHWPLFRVAGRPVGRAPDQVLAGDLRRLKRLFELGEVPEVGQVPAGKRRPLGKLVLRTGVVP